MKIFIGIPSRGNPAPAFIESLTHLAIDPDWEIEHATVVGDFVPAQRELLARLALDAGSDLLVFLDDDMVLPPQTLLELERVAATPGVGVAGALYYTRDGSKPLAVSRWSSRRTTAGSIPAFDHAPVSVDGVGFGCAAIPTAWLRRMEAPFFSAQIYLEPTARRVRLCNEDYLFCERVRDAGGIVMLHAGVRCGHFDRASQRLQPEHWEPSEATDVERMLVRTGDGSTALVPYDDSLPEADERLEHCSLEYLWAGSQPR